MSVPRLFVLDLAGTTVQDHGHVAESFTAALAAHGVTLTPEQLHGARGASKREAMRRLVPAGPDHAHRADLVHASFREQLSARFRAGGVAPMEGAERLFRSLRARGIRVALNTGFDRDITELLLGALHWSSDIVDAVVCVDDVPRGRPAPHLIFRAMELTSTMDARQVANVGDTVLDLEAGHNAGVRWNVGVLSGAHDRRRLEAAPHTHLVPSIADLPDVFFRG